MKLDPYRTSVPDRPIKERREWCSKCDGTGIVENPESKLEEVCPECNGKKYFIKRR